jgi:hypothetical protein
VAELRWKSIHDFGGDEKLSIADVLNPLVLGDDPLAKFNDQDDIAVGPLVGVKTYFIEFEASNPPPESRGFNPYITDDPYDAGSSYQWKDGHWLQHADDDLAMTVIEYKKQAH